MQDSLQPQGDDVQRSSIEIMLPDEPSSLSARPSLDLLRSEFLHTIKSPSESKWNVFIPCYGIYQDLKRRVPLYLSDIKDALHFQCLLAITFLFFTNVLPAISLGNFLHMKTDSQMGIIEVLISTCISNIIFPIFGGQPMLVIGVTGPVCLFNAALFQIAQKLNIPFLPWLTIIGLWSAAMHILMAVSNIMYTMKYVSRFVIEIFAVLTGIIFIYGAIEELFDLVVGSTAAVALTTALLSLCFTLLSLFLYEATEWTVFCKWLNNFLNSNSLLIAVVLFSGIANIPYCKTTGIQFLYMPQSFSPSLQSRNWFVLASAEKVPIQHIFSAAIPAFILTLLFFFDHNVSSALTQSKELGLKKGTAYHWDFVIVGLNVAICSLFGLPLGNCVLPQAPLHVKSLTVKSYIRDPLFLQQNNSAAAAVPSSIVSTTINQSQEMAEFTERRSLEILRQVAADNEQQKQQLQEEESVSISVTPAAESTASNNEQGESIVSPSAISPPPSQSPIALLNDENSAGNTLTIPNNEQLPVRMSSEFNRSTISMGSNGLRNNNFMIPHSMSNYSLSSSNIHVQKNVFENRVTVLVFAILVFIMTVATVELDILSFIPNGVTNGLFLFMGITSCYDLQFVFRLKLLFTWNWRQYQLDDFSLSEAHVGPQTSAGSCALMIRHVRRRTINIFTIVEILCLLFTTAIMLIPQTALLFPVAIISMIFVSKLVFPCFFSAKSLHYLDNDEGDPTEFIAQEKQERYHLKSWSQKLHDYCCFCCNVYRRGGLFR